jgi:hypothetical protein
MIISAAHDSAENAADRLARLVRLVVPNGARLSLPDEDHAAVEVLRKTLEGVWHE